MARYGCKPQFRSYVIFLNISFLLVSCFFIQIHRSRSRVFVLSSTHSVSGSRSDKNCKSLHKLHGYKARCLHLKSHGRCVSQGYIDYLYIFYCSWGRWPPLCYSLLFVWLLVLFYLLGNTASEYFCSSLESLSRLLKLSPTIAGVTLLSLGNGAADVLATLVSFIGPGPRSVGLNSVFGGAFFVSTVVVGILSISVGRRKILVSKIDFVRDVCFLIMGLVSLLVIVVLGKINLWGAIALPSMYLVYVLAVYVTHRYWKSGNEWDGELNSSWKYGSDLGMPILGDSREKEESNSLLDESHKGTADKEVGLKSKAALRRFIQILELPLSVPRRLTIPVVSEERWSKPFAVASVTFAPVLLATLWRYEIGSSRDSLLIYSVGGVVGIFLGVLAFVTTEMSHPPRKFLSLWLAGGFLMSSIWSYVIAQELIALLVSLGYILGISPSILGLTLLAWGNSLGDLITNLTMASNGGADGVQIAFSGCYAGPIFNYMVGLGLSLVVSSWHVYPSYISIPRDPFLLETLTFMVAGLVWALVILQIKHMRLDRVLGAGLLAIYLFSISLRLLQTIGSLKLYHSDT